MGAEANEPDANVFSTLWQQYKLSILLGSASLFLIFFSLIVLFKSYQTTRPIQFSSSEAEASASGQATFLTIDVEGAVIAPGLYKLPSGSRVEDAIVAAGGLSAEADGGTIAKTVNRAAKLVDGGKLFFPKQEDVVAGISQSLTISVNAGSLSELDALPGIGPVTAQKIIDNRPYQSLSELLTKKVLTQSVFENIQNKLSL